VGTGKRKRGENEESERNPRNEIIKGEKDRIEITGLGCAALNVYENCEVRRYL
jgi:hypothetical protein